MVLPAISMPLHLSISFVMYRSPYGSLRPCQGTAVSKPLACQNAFVNIADSLILAVHITDFPCAGSDISGRNICVCADMSVSSVMKLWQNAMISLSDFPFGSKSEPPLPPPMGGLSGSSEHLFKTRNLMMPRLTEGCRRRRSPYKSWIALLAD